MQSLNELNDNIISNLKIISERTSNYESLINDLSERIRLCIYKDWDNKDYESLLDNFKALFKAKKFKISWELFTFVRASHGKVKQNQIYANFWEELSTEHMRLSSNLIDELILLKISYKEAIDKFSIILELLDDDKDSKKIYFECYHMIVDALLNGNIQNNVESVCSQKINIACAGTGWSGSGAVVDYLKEFRNISFIRGEAPFFEVGDYSFLSLVNSFIEGNNFLHKIIGFFFQTIVGSVIIENNAIFKFLYLRNKRFKPERSVTALKQCLILSEIISRIIYFYNRKEFESVKVLIQKFGNELVNYVSINVDSKKIALLDNCIHIQNIHLLKYISNLHIVCVFRDPRSVYVAQCTERKSFDSDVKKFIKNYTNVIASIKEMHQIYKNENLKNKLSILSFEDFVSSDSCRANLIHNLNLSQSDWYTPKKYFDPSISIKNVNNYIDFKDQESIKMIKNQFCSVCNK